MKKKILFLTTLNLASNPRLVKEIRLAKAMNLDITVICFSFKNWSNDINQQLLLEFQDIRIIQRNGERSSFLPWFLSAVSERMFRHLSKWIELPLKNLSIAVSRRSRLLLNALDAVHSADWVIGHNPGAMYPAIVAARKFNCKAGFDVEDYHPGEGNDTLLQKNTLDLMKQVLPGFSYLSFASDSIMDECIRHTDVSTTRTIVVNNAFPQSEFTVPEEISDEKLRLVWFSQHINKGRGLEDIVSIVKKHSDKLKLTLFGNYNTLFKEQYLDGTDAITSGGVLQQTELHKQLAFFDIGIASEDASTDLNRNICLTNKIWAYFQSGLFIIASSTTAQNKFIENHKFHGVCYNSPEEFESKLLRLFSEKHSIRKDRILRFENAQQLNWELESKKLQTIWAG